MSPALYSRCSGVHRAKPLVVFGIQQTIEALKKHIFNNVMWPDFTKIPGAENPSVVVQTIKIGQTIAVD
ncbi:hypothetical protein [Polynucleobacter antarcticus]|uniref:Uncharacterized protein n=1 Tax=Polynucleobacter antarcticus TaxID=1743162 RepID=A0A6M9PVM9_9BURK|nr:hypothetical protein [Polynucleobacter antarcticus]QKM61976.1 hypothetical protein DCO16_02100 [Polynucleobacter antarcticus]